MSETTSLQNYLKGGDMNRRDLAATLDVDPVTVWRWATKRVPSDRCRAVSEITGIPLHELRPDLYPAPSGVEA